MKRRISLEWSGEGFTTLWTMDHGFLHYHPAHQAKLIHELFGGENYYVSRTERTGAGYITPKAQDIIVPFGSYRTDVRGPEHQSRRIVGHHDGGKPIFGYHPVENGGLPDGNYPIVLTDGRKIYFARLPMVAPALRIWDDLPWLTAKQINFAYLDMWGLCYSHQTILLLNNSLYGIDALRFADLRAARREAEMILQASEPVHYWMDILGIYRPNQGDHYVVYNKQHDFFYKKFPINEWPAEVNGWAIRHDSDIDKLFCYRQNNDLVRAMVVNLATDAEYEQTYSVYEFRPAEVIGGLYSRLYAKEEKNKKLQLAALSRTEELRKTMEQRPDTVVTVADSEQAGNCPDGTRDFLKRYNLPEENLFSDLLKHPDFKEMFEGVYFRRVITHVLKKEE